MLLSSLKRFIGDDMIDLLLLLRLAKTILFRSHRRRLPLGFIPSGLS